MTAVKGTTAAGLALCALFALPGCDSPEGVQTAKSLFRGTPDFVPENDEGNCLDRQGEVVGTGDEPATMRGMVPDALRWAVADIGPSTRAGHQGVNAIGQDERGQEYTEYYAVVSPKLINEHTDNEFGLDADPIALGQLFLEGEKCSFGPPVTENALPDDVAEALDAMSADHDLGDTTVGACVFHSWHNDIGKAPPACEENGCMEQDPGDGSDSNFPVSEYAFPLPLNADNLKMKVCFNSNFAAADLVQKCFHGFGEDGNPVIPEFKDGDLAEEPFFRGCTGAAHLFNTEWRRSDPTVCAAANRLRECSCSIPGVTDGMSLAEASFAVGAAVVPPEGAPNSYRGFVLGSWGDSDPDELASESLWDRLTAPPGCRYVDLGDDSKTVMVCRLTVDDFLKDEDDPKETCREKYGDNVVVHVPIPASAVECSPTGAERGGTCGSMPWNIGFEGEATTRDPAPGDDCFVARKGSGCGDDKIAKCVCDSADGGFGDRGCCDGDWDTKCVSEAEACAAE